VKIEERQPTKVELASICSSRPVVRRIPPPGDLKKFTRRLTDKSDVTAATKIKGVYPHNTLDRLSNSSGGLPALDRGDQTSDDKRRDYQ
jgi:hypothetical protein